MRLLAGASLLALVLCIALLLGHGAGLEEPVDPGPFCRLEGSSCRGPCAGDGCTLDGPKSQSLREGAELAGGSARGSPTGSFSAESRTTGGDPHGGSSGGGVDGGGIPAAGGGAEAPREASAAGAEGGESLRERLTLRQLRDGTHVLVSARQLTSTPLPAQGAASTQSALFPAFLLRLARELRVSRLSLTFTTGRWDYSRWGWGSAGLTPQPKPAGVELWASFCAPPSQVDELWEYLSRALSGHFCASLASLVTTGASAAPRWHLHPSCSPAEAAAADASRSTNLGPRHGSAARAEVRQQGSGHQAGNGSTSGRRGGASCSSSCGCPGTETVRYGHLPQELMCSENIHPWMRLLPCRGLAGPFALLNTTRLYSAPFQSLRLELFRETGAAPAPGQAAGEGSSSSSSGAASTAPGRVSLLQEMSYVHRLERGSHSAGREAATGAQGDGGAHSPAPAMRWHAPPSWSAESLFGRSLPEACPVASSSQVVVELERALFPSPKDGRDSSCCQSSPSPSPPSSSSSPPSGASPGSSGARLAEDWVRHSKALSISPASWAPAYWAVLGADSSESWNLAPQGAGVAQGRGVCGEGQDVLAVPFLLQGDSSTDVTAGGLKDVAVKWNQLAAGQGDLATTLPKEGFVAEQYLMGGGNGGWQATLALEVHRPVLHKRRREDSSASADCPPTPEEEGPSSGGNLQSNRSSKGSPQACCASVEGGAGCMSLSAMQVLPWWLRPLLHTLQLQVDGVPQPLDPPAVQLWVQPGREKKAPAVLELLLCLPRDSASVLLTVKLHKMFLSVFDFPPDASRGLDLPPALVTLSQVSNTGQSQHFQTGEYSYTKSVVVGMPEPDMSMPYNVITLTCTLLAIIMGSMLNVLRHRFESEDSSKKSQDPKGEKSTAFASRSKLLRLFLVLVFCVIFCLWSFGLLD